MTQGTPTVFHSIMRKESEKGWIYAYVYLKLYMFNLWILYY